MCVQQQCIGPMHIPLSDYSIISNDFSFKNGIVSAIGEQPFYSIVDSESMVDMTIGEMLTNIMFSGIPINRIKCNVCVSSYTSALRAIRRFQKLIISTWDRYLRRRESLKMEI